MTRSGLKARFQAKPQAAHNTKSSSPTGAARALTGSGHTRFCSKGALKHLSSRIGVVDSQIGQRDVMHTLHDLAPPIHNANAREFQRHVDSDIVFHGCPPSQMPGADSTS